MKHTSISFATFASLLLLNSCTNENELLSSSKSEFINSVRVSVEDFIPEKSNTETRTAYTVDDTGFHFQWAEGDALGIYPVGGDQVKFPISSGDGSATATFDGGAWKLRSEYQYAAYYPFSADNYKIAETAIPVDYNGQTQVGNGSTAHLGAYDFLAAGATEPDEYGGVNLTMKHLGCFVRLQLTIPEENTLKSVRIASNNAPFSVKGTVDLSDTIPAITPVTTSKYTELKLEDVTVEADETVTLYMMMAPVDMRSSLLTFTVSGNGGISYSQTLSAGKNMETGKSYSYELTLDKDDSQYVAVDLGLPSGLKWASFNIGATAPEEYGNMFAWGETETKDGFSLSNYAYCKRVVTTDNDGFEITEYQWEEFGGELYDDGGTWFFDISGSSHDVATIQWKGSWHMPNRANTKELINECTWNWSTKNGISGYKVTGPNGNWIFIPAGYYWVGSGVEYIPTDGILLASSLYIQNNYYGFTEYYFGSYEPRCIGKVVRPVTQ